jgi:hypothetical protein
VPSHAYMKMLYRYPQAAFPYTRLVEENARRTKDDPEFELIDTGAFAEDRFFDVTIEYAKVSPEDIVIRFTIVNHGPEAAPLALLPTLWFRNTWSWRHGSYKPAIRRGDERHVVAEHESIGTWRLESEQTPTWLFTENETNYERLYGVANSSPYVKDAFHAYVVEGRQGAVNEEGIGTKVAALFSFTLQPKETRVVRLRLAREGGDALRVAQCDDTIEKRRIEASEFYDDLAPFPIDDDERAIMRQAFAGMLWNKQFYYYVVQEWLDGDPAMPPPPPQRKKGRNSDWEQFHAANVLSMPDTWEYPWFAEWDLSFHCVVLAVIDPEFAKHQLMLLTREWYMHPNGQLPAYEWAFGDVNPPLMAWSALRIYQIERKMTGIGDRLFLERVFQKLLLAFTWWVNRKDPDGKNVFQGGFLGLDNIGVLDRNRTLPPGCHLDQSDGTSWMGVFSITMLTIAIELAAELPAYEDIASKFYAHFLYIAKAINEIGGEGLWDETDGFYYDYLHLDGEPPIPLRVRSVVGLIPLLANGVGEADLLQRLPDLDKRVRWFVRNRPDLTESIISMQKGGYAGRYLLSIVDTDKLLRILSRMLDESEFLSPYGIRSLSRFHAAHPYVLRADGEERSICYEPAESREGNFGGNSNWRGPIWFPINFLVIEALQRLHYYYGDDFRVECPTGSGVYVTLWDAANEISHRLMTIFERAPDGRRAVFGGNAVFQNNPLWRDLIPFYEYFNGDDGAGLGASHQTGWTGLIAKILLQHGEYCAQGKDPLATPKEDL